MVKINREFDEGIRETILAHLVSIIDDVNESSEKNSDHIIKDILKNYYKRRKPVENPFSEELISIIKKDYILQILQNNKENFEEINQSIIDKLVLYFTDIFVDRYYKYKESIELRDE